MINDYYSFSRSSDFKSFEFISSGKKGDVLKRVQFIPTETPHTFNLGLGDVDPSVNIFETITTDNGDTRKLLNTINKIVLEFLKTNQLYQVIIKGTTPARNRLFKMHISSNIDSLTDQFIVFGYSGGIWEKFKKGHSYTIFLIRHKR